MKKWIFELSQARHEYRDYLELFLDNTNQNPLVYVMENESNIDNKSAMLFITLDAMHEKLGQIIMSKIDHIFCKVCVSSGL